MKKLITLLFFATIAMQLTAQIRPGKYRIYFAENNLSLIETNRNYLEMDNKPATGSADVWEVKQVIGKLNTYYIQNSVSKKCITWSNVSSNTVQVNPLLTMEPLGSKGAMQKQSFKFNNPKENIYAIYPDHDGVTDRNQFAMGTTSAMGPGASVACTNTIGVDTKFYTWQVEAAQQVNVTGPLALPKSTPAALLNNANKIEIDFKTGGDNLEPKSFQKNLQVTIKIRNRPNIVLDDVNKNQAWPNNSVRRISAPLPGDIDVADMESITLLRTVVSTWNNVDGGSGDNWNLDNITATAIVKKEGRFIRTLLLNQSGAPLFRFVYEVRGSAKPNEGLTKTFNFTPGSLTTTVTPPPPPSTPALASITAIFGTGGDNLEGGNDNVNITIRYKSKPQVTFIANLNNRANWANWSENTVNKIIPNSTTLDINDIKEVELRHTGGGGFAADNWHLDKFKLTITKGTQTKVLVDRVAAPIHMFTGDTRSKRFVME